MRLVRVALTAIVLIAMAGPGRAQELAPDDVDDRPASAESCTRAMVRTQELLGQRQYVDAHLLAQTMSLLCLHSWADWNILDAIALTHLEEHQRAHALLESLALQPGPLAARAEVLAAWVLVHGNLGRSTTTGRLAPQDAARIQVYARIQRGQSPGSQAKALSEDVRTAVTAGYARLQASPHKRPWLAGSLSAIVPGLGQAYAGSWQGAGMSLLLNGLFAAATVELVRNELYFASATTGVAGSIFYVGNILNAVDLARRYNQGATAAQRAELGRLLIPEAHF